MQLILEDLEYQRRAIAAAVGVLERQVRNLFDNSNLFRADFKPRVPMP